MDTRPDGIIFSPRPGVFTGNPNVGRAKKDKPIKNPNIPDGADGVRFEEAKKRKKPPKKSKNCVDKTFSVD